MLIVARTSSKRFGQNISLFLDCGRFLKSRYFTPRFYISFPIPIQPLFRILILLKQFPKMALI